jgi:hypothetical protein
MTRVLVYCGSCGAGRVVGDLAARADSAAVGAAHVGAKIVEVTSTSADRRSPWRTGRFYGAGGVRELGSLQLAIQGVGKVPGGSWR